MFHINTDSPILVCYECGVKYEMIDPPTFIPNDPNIKSMKEWETAKNQRGKVSLGTKQTRCPKCQAKHRINSPENN